MEVDRPGPGEEVNLGAPTEPRQAATVIVLRGGADALEVLLVQRNPAQRFMGGAWVFPGGAVHGDEPHARTAARELREEAGIDADPAGFVTFSRWITPAMVKTRFDTWFYLASVPNGARPEVDGEECVDWRWATPQQALAAYRAGELMLVFPTIKHLEQLAAFPSAEAALAHARGQEVRPVEPRVEVQGETARILLPGEPGYDEA